MEELLQPEPPDQAEPERSAPSDPLEHSLTPGEVTSLPQPEHEPLAEYEELDVLGTGGAGVVTLARHRETGARVAIKRLRKETAHLGPRFLREAEAIANLAHPCIVRLERVITAADGTKPMALVLELVEGPDLERLVQRQGRLSVSQSLQIGLALAQALGHAHEQGVIHRDVKPGNVLIAPGGRPKLTDFGLALPVEAQVSLTISGQPLGTLDYMAPEQWSGRAVDERADQYGLGATLYRMLTGNSPRVIRERRLPEVASELVLRCLEEQPADRFESMSAVARQIERALVRALEDSSGVHAPLERVSQRLRDDLARARQRGGSQRLRAAAVGLSALGLLPNASPAQVTSHMELGTPVEVVLQDLVETILQRASQRGLQRPLLLADATAVLRTALIGTELSSVAHKTIDRLAEASRVPVRSDPTQRLARVVGQLASRGALTATDVSWLVGNRGSLMVVLEGVLSRLRTRAQAASPDESRANLARWRHALEALRDALPESATATRIHEELLALELERVARRRGDPAEEDVA